MMAEYTEEIISVRMQRRINGRLASVEFTVERSLLDDMPSAGKVILDMLERGFEAGLKTADPTADKEGA